MDLPNTDAVLVDEINNKGIITLNRPETLNAGTYEMAQKIFVAINNWKDTKSMIIIKGNGKAFSAGSDLKKLTDPDLYEIGMKFLKVEYTVDFMIANLKIPYVSLIDGYIMGGGVGYSIHGKYSVATERTVFAMPETIVGASPDVGASYFFPRLKGKLGYYLALTGSRLHGIDVLHAGLATHYCDSNKINDLEKALITLDNMDDVEKVLNEYCPQFQSEFSLTKHLDRIDRCFNASTVEGILKLLEDDGSEWAKQTIKELRLVSPTGAKLALKQLQLGENLSLGESLQLDYFIVHRMLKHKDFRKGVAARLIRKDNNPKWDPDRIEDVSDEHVMQFFKPLPISDELPIDVKLNAKF